MKYFQCDYAEGAHPRVMEALMRTNMEQTAGYGMDEYCARAADKIRALCQAPHAAVHFLTGGTQVNLIAVSAALRPHQSVICTPIGHINTHETGAVEAAGHKCLTVPEDNGRVTAEEVRKCVLAHDTEHETQPGMVYISIATESGTNYTRAELARLYDVCQEYGLILYVDGARLACAMADAACDWDLPFLCAHCHAFTMGGTKNGLLFGEAIIIRHAGMARDFRYIIKQRGGMLAKGRLLGVQFDAILEDGLYFQLGRHAVQLADKIRRELTALGLTFYAENGTNQVFPIMRDTVLSALSDRYRFEPWGRVDESHSAVRIATSWATREEDVDQLLIDIKAAMA